MLSGEKSLRDNRALEVAGEKENGKKRKNKDTNLEPQKEKTT